MKTVNKITIQLTIESGKRTRLNVYGYVRGDESRLIRINGYKKQVGELTNDLVNKIQTILEGW